MEKNTHVELSNKKGSLANALLANKDDIEKACNSGSISEAKAVITNIVMNINDKPLEKKSVATKRFLNNLAKQRYTSGALTLVWNTILAGDNEGVI